MISSFDCVTRLAARAAVEPRVARPARACCATRAPPKLRLDACMLQVCILRDRWCAFARSDVCVVLSDYSTPAQRNSSTSTQHKDVHDVIKHEIVSV